MLRNRGLYLLTCVGLGLAAACDGPTETPVAATEIQEIDADQVLYNMVSYLTASGVREGRVLADTAYFFVDSSKVHIVGMNVIFYDEDGRPRATVTALGGEMDQSTDAMVARGDVVLIVHADGRKIESAELIYDPNRNRLRSDSATVQTMPNGQVTRGSAFESDLEFRNFRLRDPRGQLGDVIF